MGRIVQNCLNQLREMSVVNLEETMESLSRQGFGDTALAAALPATTAGAGSSAAGAELGDMDTTTDDKPDASLTLLGAIVAKLLTLIKCVAFPICGHRASSYSPFYFPVPTSAALCCCDTAPLSLHCGCLDRSGVGVPTRGASARTLKTVAEIAGAAMQPYATQASRVLSNGLEDQVCMYWFLAAVGAAAAAADDDDDKMMMMMMMMMTMMTMFFLLTPATIVLKSPALRLEFAKAAAEISKIAKQGTVRKYVERLQTLYDTADDGNRFTSGYAMNALATACLDKIQRYMPEIVPLAFMVREAVLCSFVV
jgi:hypothetical protein